MRPTTRGSSEQKAPGTRRSDRGRPSDLARDGGPVPVITGVHSVVVEDGVVCVGFDLARNGTEEATLFFEFRLPIQLVSRDELPEFARWLASPSSGTMN